MQTGLTALMIVVAAVFGVLAMYGVGIPGLSLATPAEPTRLEVAPERLTTSRSLVLGSKDAEFSLIMFGDYECPPCKREWPSIVSLQKRHMNRLAVYFRHLPLTSIHPNAFPAALLAETSKLNSTGRIVHDALYTTPLNEASIESIRNQYNVEDDGQPLKKARENVLQDINLAASLGVQGTPSFLIVHDGKAFRMESLDQAERMIH